MSFITSQLVEIIEWTDDSRDTLSYRFPDEDKEIKRGAQLVVRESQMVQLVYLGQFGDVFGPGTHTLITDNIPVLTRLQGWKYGFESPFKTDVYYVVTRLLTGNKWGTSNPVMVRDQDFGVVRLRAFGTYDFRVVDIPRFLKEVAGTDDHFRIDDFADAMRSRIVSVFSSALASSKIPALDISTRYSELGAALLPLINPVLKEKYGLEMTSFILENVSVPPEVEQAIDKRSSMAAVGDLNDYVKFQMAQSIGKGGGDGGGLANSAAQLGAGLAMGQQLAAALNTSHAAPPVISPPAGSVQMLSPDEVAKTLGVSEADVVATLEKGELKGKKIGSVWRVSKPALDEYLKS
jgi:excisionase family DNA binding protein